MTAMLQDRERVVNAIWLLAGAALYFAAARLGLSLAYLHANVSPVWPATGVAVAAVLWRGYRICPAILLGAFLANAATPISLPTAAGIAVGNTLEAVVAALLLRRFVAYHSPFNRVQDVLRFIFAAGVAGPMLGATIGAISLCCGGAARWDNFGPLWLTWWLGDGVGALIVAPLLLTWCEKPVQRWSSLRIFEGVLLLLLLSFVAFSVFRGGFFTRAVNYPLGHLTIPFLLWAAFRFGPRGVATALTVMSGIAVLGTTRGYGPFAEPNLNESLLLLQGFVAALAITAAITAAVVAEHQEARQTIDLLASIVHSTTDAIVGKTLDGTIISWNAGAELLYGYAASEAIGKSIRVLMPPDRADELPRFLETLRRGESITNFETAWVRNDGRQLPVSLTISPIRNAAGDAIGASVIAHDITARVRVEEERRQLLQREQAARAAAENADRAKDDFLAILSHELRTPLAVIVGWVDILHLQANTPEMADESLNQRGLEVIKRSAGTQLHIIEDILDVSRIVAGKMHLNLLPVKLAGVVRTTIEDMQPAAGAKDITLHTDLDDNAEALLGDAHRLHQVVWNLVSNAIKFTPPGGTIDVRLKQVDDRLHLSVRDTGIGIDPEFLPHVFDRFIQADSSATRRYGGLGLGLAIVRYLAGAHGGRVEVQSAGVDQGATFTVVLPCLSAVTAGGHDLPAAAANQTSLSGTGLAGKRILTVDDDIHSREMVNTILVLQGATVKTAASVREALEIMQGWPPDVLISDLGMPDEDGYDLIRAVRQRDAGRETRLPAIALTAYASDDDRQRALAAGYQLHLAKPVTPHNLVAAVIEAGG